MRAESECCPFLSFEPVDRDGELRLTVSGVTQAGPVLDDMLTALHGS